MKQPVVAVAILAVSYVGAMSMYKEQLACETSLFKNSKAISADSQTSYEIPPPKCGWCIPGGAGEP